MTKACVEALRRHHDLNAHWTAEGHWRRKDINIGIAVAVPDGLVVPVIKNAQDLSLHGLNVAINDLAARARSKRLRPEDLEGGTFTVDNTGWTGSILTLPIINVPEVAIITMEKIVKRPVVLEAQGRRHRDPLDDEHVHRHRPSRHRRRAGRRVPGRRADLARVGRRAHADLVGHGPRAADVRTRGAQRRVCGPRRPCRPAADHRHGWRSVDTAGLDGPDARRHPDWIRASACPAAPNYEELKSLMRDLTLNTVCEEARCPNIGECWEQRTATVMILGDTCTRACGFCAVKTGRPTLGRRRRAAPRGRGGQGHGPRARRRDQRRARRPARRRRAASSPRPSASCGASLPGIGVEVLIPDFDGRRPRRCGRSWRPAPDILNHNVETVERLQKPVRKRARYDRSLDVLASAKADGARASPDARAPCTPSRASWSASARRATSSARPSATCAAVDCDILTIGQYLRPSVAHLPVERYVHPDEFAEMKVEALALGFKHVESGPLVRSSYHARDQVPEAARRARTARGSALTANGLPIAS